MDADERKPVLIIATLSAFITPFSSSALNVALPQMGTELLADGVTLGWIVSVYLLIAAMVLVPLGRIADIKGRRKVFQYGAWIYGFASILLALAPSTVVVIVLRTAQGLGGAMMFGTGIALLSSVYPASERGRALGFNVAAVYIGLSLGPFVGGFLTQHFGWRSIFLFSAILGIATAIITTWKLNGEWATARDEKFDLKGSILFSATIVAVMLGFSTLPAIYGFGLLGAGALGFVVFALFEARVRHPILHVGLFRDNNAFAFSNLAALLNYSAVSAVGFLLSLYLHFAKGLSPQTTGLVLVSQPIVMAIFSPLAGRLSDRIEPRTMASLGMGFTCSGLLVLANVDANSSLPFIVSTLVVLGFGFALFSSPNVNAIMGSVDKSLYGVASGMMGTVRLMGQMLSMGISMSIIAVFIGPIQITPEQGVELVKAVRVAFLVFGALCFGGVFASLARGKLH